MEFQDKQVIIVLFDPLKIINFLSRRHVYCYNHHIYTNAHKSIQGLKVRYNITYIVIGMAIQDGKVLMIQEAKPRCHETWYLPAGRMEENETIVVGFASHGYYYLIG